MAVVAVALDMGLGLGLVVAGRVVGVDGVGVGVGYFAVCLWVSVSPQWAGLNFLQKHQISK